MPLTAPWLAGVGTIVLVVGLSLLIADLTGPYRAGLMLLVGCLFWVAFLVVNELPPRDIEQCNDVPWGSLWPFIAMLAIAVVGLSMEWWLR
jgi:hypothetical protein